MTPEEYINSLSVEEMRYVLRQFWDWWNNEGCPWIATGDDYECGAEADEFGDRQCAESVDTEEQNGCWLKYYVWKFRKNKENEND